MMKKTYRCQTTSSVLWYISCVMIVFLLCPQTSSQKELKDVVRDFKCVTHNFDHYINCTWKLDVSETEAENIELNVTWQVLGRLLLCPVLTKTSCVIRMLEDGLDPDINVKFHIMLTKYPDGGGVNITFPVHVPSVAKPYKVTDLSGNSNSSCVNLTWSHSRNMFSLQYQIRYSNKWSAKIQELIVIGDEYAEDDITRSTICNLHPYTTYTFHVRCKPQSGAGFWSEDASIIIGTKKDVPSRGPHIPLGGFRSIPEHHGYRHVEIFWQNIEEQYRNGDKVLYNLNVYRGDSKVKEVFFTTSHTSAKFKHLLQNTTYRVTIYPANEAGISHNISSIVIPSVKEMPESPKMVIARRDTKSTVRVNWEPIRKKDIATVTLYWCKAAVPSCADSVQWNTFSAASNSTVLDISNSLNTPFLLGASAETFNGKSSGIHWSKCIITDMDTHHEIAIGISAIYEERKVAIHWKFSSCAGEIFQGEVSQFILHICRTQPCEEKEIHSENGETRSLLTDARAGETICATVTAELRDGRKIQSEQKCERIDEFHRIPLEVIIPVSTLLLILVCLGAWCLWKTSAKNIQQCMRPYDIDVPQPKKITDTVTNPEYIEVTVETPCIGGETEQTEPSESLTPTSDTSLIPILDSGGYVLRDS